MYRRLTRSHIRVEFASPANPRVKNYLNNYFAMYKRLKRLHIGVELGSRAYLELKII